MSVDHVLVSHHVGVHVVLVHHHLSLRGQRRSVLSCHVSNRESLSLEMLSSNCRGHCVRLDVFNHRLALHVLLELREVFVHLFSFFVLTFGLEFCDVEIVESFN